MIQLKFYKDYELIHNTYKGSNVIHLLIHLILLFLYYFISTFLLSLFFFLVHLFIIFTIKKNLKLYFKIIF